MLTALILIATKSLLIAAQTTADDLPCFASFIAEHSRTYVHGSEEYAFRHDLFKKRVAEVREQNSQPNQLWTAAINHLSDRTDEELSSLKGWKGFAGVGRSVGQIDLHQAQGSTSKVFLGQTKMSVLPDNHTWAHLESIKADVDQQSCGSCWAVATTTMMNAAAEIAGKKSSFAAQDLVNCVPNPHNCGGSGGCDGSTVELAMNWIASNGFRTTDLSPYRATDMQCYTSLLQQTGGSSTSPRNLYSGAELEKMIAVGQHEVPSGSLGAELGLKHWTRLPENEYSPVMFHLVQNGPLAVSVAADGWYFYNAGIFDRCKVDAVIDHAVVLFGYGYDATRKVSFWEIKNSWGSNWGENGNVRMPRVAASTPCGIDRQPEVGTGCDGGPKEVKVCGTCGILYDAVSVSM